MALLILPPPPGPLPRGEGETLTPCLDARPLPFAHSGRDQPGTDHVLSPRSPWLQPRQGPAPPRHAGPSPLSPGFVETNATSPPGRGQKKRRGYRIKWPTAGLGRDLLSSRPHTTRAGLSRRQSARYMITRGLTAKAVRVIVRDSKRLPATTPTAAIDIIEIPIYSAQPPNI